jgi:integrase
MAWPKGIRPDGAGLRIKIWSKGRLIYSETLKGDPTSKKLLATAYKRREWLLARQKLGLPLYASEAGDHQSFEQVAKDYLASLDVKRSTAMSYESIVNTYWSAFNGWPAREITKADIKRVLKEHDVAPKTKMNALIVLRNILNHAEVSPNPVEQVKIKRGQKVPVSRYTPHERSELLAQLDGQVSVYFALLFGCGLRPGEALGLLWTDYDGEELSITKQMTRRRLEPTTKTSVRRMVYVPKWVRPYLNNHPTRFDGGHIFQTEKGNYHRDTDVFNEEWQRAHRRARIPYRIPYTCRHSRAAELLSTGVDPAEAAKQLGHSVELFLRTYSEWIEAYSKGQDKSRFEGFTDEKPTKKMALPAAAAQVIDSK